jgi:hypothetical protein
VLNDTYSNCQIFESVIGPGKASADSSIPLATASFCHTDHLRQIASTSTIIVSLGRSSADIPQVDLNSQTIRYDQHSGTLGLHLFDGGFGAIFVSRERCVGYFAPLPALLCPSWTDSIYRPSICLQGTSSSPDYGAPSCITASHDRVGGSFLCIMGRRDSIGAFLHRVNHVTTARRSSLPSYMNAGAGSKVLSPTAL